jgi:hypothetical protein
VLSTTTATTRIGGGFDKKTSKAKLAQEPASTSTAS